MFSGTLFIDRKSALIIGVNRPMALKRHTHMNDDALVEQTLLLSCHDKVVCVVFVVDDVLQIDPCERDKTVDLHESVSYFLAHSRL